FIADAAVLDQVRVVDADHVLGTSIAWVGDGETETVAFLELDTLVSEFGDADLWALQVAEQRNEAPVLGGNLTHHAGACLVLIGGTMGEIQAGHVEPCQDQFLHDLWGAAGGAEGGDNFGAARNHSGLLVFQACPEAPPPLPCSHCSCALPNCAGLRTSRSQCTASRMRSAVLPINALSRLPRAMAPISIRSMFRSSTKRGMVCSAYPSSN